MNAKRDALVELVAARKVTIDSYIITEYLYRIVSQLSLNVQMKNKQI